MKISREKNMRYSHHLLMLMAAFQCASAQSPPTTSSSTSPNSPYLENNFNPSMAIIIVILISAFFLLGFFSIYIRNCAGDRLAPRSTNGVTGPTTSRRGPRGLDPEILSSFPTMIYSDVKNHKIGLSSLECAVCLSEFDEDDQLRLLPKCSHVFHPDCIDAWLSAHVTCPVCRAKLDDDSDPIKPDSAAIPIPVPEPTNQDETLAGESAEHKITIEGEASGSETELAELERFINMKRSRSRFPRSHSTGHSLLVLPGENLERFTLRLPEEIKREVLERSGSMAMPRGVGEGSIGGRRGRSIRLGGSRSEKWGSFLIRSFSAKWPNWGRRGEGEGSRSMKGEGSSTKRGKHLGSIGSIKEVHH